MKRSRQVVLSPAGCDGSGRLPNNSSVLAFGVAVNATYVMPTSSLARDAISSCQNFFGAYITAVFKTLFARQQKAPA